jgi:hypothetical protein
MSFPLRAPIDAKPSLPSPVVSAGESPLFIRRKQAGEYSQRTYGFGSARTFAKAAVTGDGPEFHKAGRVVLYTKDAIDKWALAKIGAARRSTSAA